jgi:hypothetical protein
MVASLYRNHTVVVGLGTVGYQIVHELLSLREPVVDESGEEGVKVWCPKSGLQIAQAALLLLRT